MLTMCLAHLRIVDVSQSCYLERSILDANALLLIREGDDLAVAAVGDERGAVRAGSVFVEKARQHVYSNIGRCAAEEVDTVEYCNTQKENGIAGVRVD